MTGAPCSRTNAPCLKQGRASTPLPVAGRYYPLHAISENCGRGSAPIEHDMIPAHMHALQGVGLERCGASTVHTRTPSLPTVTTVAAMCACDQERVRHLSRVARGRLAATLSPASPDAPARVASLAAPWGFKGMAGVGDDGDVVVSVRAGVGCMIHGLLARHLPTRHQKDGRQRALVCNLLLRSADEAIVAGGHLGEAESGA